MSLPTPDTFIVVKNSCCQDVRRCNLIGNWGATQYPSSAAFDKRKSRLFRQPLSKEGYIYATPNGQKLLFSRSCRSNARGGHICSIQLKVKLLD